MTIADKVNPEVDTAASTSTVSGALRWATSALSRVGVASPRNDAEILAAHLLQVDRSRLWQWLDEPVPVGFLDLIKRRAERIPLQHLTGVAHFRTHSLCVGPGVFIPRPETELVVEAALDLLASITAPAPTVVDLCAGSGAIAVSIATEHRDCTVHAVEIDAGATPWLKQNTANTEVQVHRQDAASALPDLTGQVDLVVSNPPYIPVESVPRDVEVAIY
ncbi:MAG TPA: HemK/PrmC family methyltransferase, partial [Burkholderiaceae bacterium]|nr:HemK/PrmC family methyltransferase [Burkholderiaceae bacterium]